MEVAIIGLIAGLGYAISRQGAADRKSNKKDESVTANRPESYPFAGITTSEQLLKEQEKASEERWKASQNPRATGIVDPRTLPFFRSAKTQNTSESINQRRMEHYSGKMNEATWQHKKEQGPRFDPAPQNVTSNGTAGNGSAYNSLRKMSAVSGIQNSVLPFKQIQVGRGVGVDASVPATDGFHSMYRIMPVDHSSYKKNSLQGRVNHGVAVNSAREVDPKFYSKGVPRFYTMERRPLEKGRAVYTAPTHRSTIPMPGCHVDTEEYFGIAGATGQNVQAGAASRDKSDVRPGLPLTNVTNDRYGVGSYAVAEFDDAKMISQQRESTRTHGILTGDRRAQKAPNTFVVAPTKRDLLTRHEHMGGAGHYVPAGTTQPNDVPQPTIREQLHDQTNGFAPAAPVIRGATVQCTNKQLLKEAKRGSQVVNTYVAHAQRTDAYRRTKVGDDLLAEKRCIPMAVKPDGNIHRMLGHPQASVMYMNQAGPGESSIKDRARLPEENRFQDYTIARANLEKNEYHIRIN